MTLIEIILLVIAYSVIIVTIFLEIVCYKRNLEYIETIALTVSLLLLIISLTLSPLWKDSSTEEATNIFTLIAMILVGLTTPLNIMAERKHDVSDVWKKLIFGTSALVVLITIVGFYTQTLSYLQYAAISFLAISIVSSMVLIRTTQPKKKNAHREKIEQIFAIAFLIVVPISLLVNYAFTKGDTPLQIGFTLPLMFILLSGNKLIDDLQRLSLFNPKVELKEQHFQNYALTTREKEIAALLTEGKTYKQISTKLFISLPTVKTHASNIYRKCGVKNRSTLTALLIN